MAGTPKWKPVEIWFILNLKRQKRTVASIVSAFKRKFPKNNILRDEKSINYVWQQYGQHPEYDPKRWPEFVKRYQEFERIYGQRFSRQGLFNSGSDITGSLRNMNTTSPAVIEPGALESLSMNSQASGMRRASGGEKFASLTEPQLPKRNETTYDLYERFGDSPFLQSSNSQKQPQNSSYIYQVSDAISFNDFPHPPSSYFSDIEEPNTPNRVLSHYNPSSCSSPSYRVAKNQRRPQPTSIHRSNAKFTGFRSKKDPINTPSKLETVHARSLLLTEPLNSPSPSQWRGPVEVSRMGGYRLTLDRDSLSDPFSVCDVNGGGLVTDVMLLPTFVLQHFTMVMQTQHGIQPEAGLAGYPTGIKAAKSSYPNGGPITPERQSNVLSNSSKQAPLRQYRSESFPRQQELGESESSACPTHCRSNTTDIGHHQYHSYSPSIAKYSQRALGSLVREMEREDYPDSIGIEIQRSSPTRSISQTIGTHSAMETPTRSNGRRREDDHMTSCNAGFGQQMELESGMNAPLGNHTPERYRQRNTGAGYDHVRDNELETMRPRLNAQLHHKFQHKCDTNQDQNAPPLTLDHSFDRTLENDTAFSPIQPQLINPNNYSPILLANPSRRSSVSQSLASTPFSPTLPDLAAGNSPKVGSGFTDPYPYTIKAEGDIVTIVGAVFSTPVILPPMSHGWNISTSGQKGPHQYLALSHPGSRRSIRLVDAHFEQGIVTAENHQVVASPSEIQSLNMAVTPPTDGNVSAATHYFPSSRQDDKVSSNEVTKNHEDSRFLAVDIPSSPLQAGATTMISAPTTPLPYHPQTPLVNATLLVTSPSPPAPFTPSYSGSLIGSQTNFMRGLILTDPMTTTDMDFEELFSGYHLRDVAGQEDEWTDELRNLVEQNMLENMD